MRRRNIEIVTGDIVKQVVDAVVNPSNLFYEVGEVSKAIHMAAGPDLKLECDRIAINKPANRLQPGEVVITKGYNLPAKYVIHTSGLVWNTSQNNEREALYKCYYNSLLLSTKHRLNSIAFPLIGSGIDGVPAEISEEIANKAFNDFMEVYKSNIVRIVLVKYSGL